MFDDQACHTNIFGSPWWDIPYCISLHAKNPPAKIYFWDINDFQFFSRKKVLENIYEFPPLICISNKCSFTETSGFKPSNVDINL